MINGQTIGLVIPCHNEEAGLRQLLPLVPTEVDKVLIVDNNSTDATAAIAGQHGAPVIKEVRPGYGAAYQTGLTAIQTDIIVTLDGDGQYPVSDVPRLVGIFLEKGFDFLSACRFPLPAGSMPALRQVGNFLLTAVTQILFSVHIKDTQSGMWVFRRSLLQRIQAREPGMAFSEELKIKVMLAGLKFGEEHIVYQPRQGESKLAPFGDGWRILWYLVRLRVGRG